MLFLLIINFDKYLVSLFYNMSTGTIGQGFVGNAVYQKFKKLRIIFNVKFLNKRNSIKNFNNQEIIIFVGRRPVTSTFKQIYSSVFLNPFVIITGSKHAEMIKYYINRFLANKLSFVNKMFKLCYAFDLDYDKVVQHINDKLRKNRDWENMKLTAII